jgi:hypothetical protein
MVDPIAATSFGRQAFSTLRQIARPFNELKTKVEIQSRVIELQGAILVAQDAALRMQLALAEERAPTASACGDK